MKPDLQTRIKRALSLKKIRRVLLKNLPAIITLASLLVLCASIITIINQIASHTHIIKTDSSQSSIVIEEQSNNFTVTASMTQTSTSGEGETCPFTLTWDIVLDATQPGVVQYQFNREGEDAGAVETHTFNSSLRHSITHSWQNTNSKKKIEFKILSPNLMTIRRDAINNCKNT